MPDARYIKINDISLSVRAGKPSTYHGLLSGNELAIISLEFVLTSPHEKQVFERLRSQEKVQVDDPFVSRTYAAALQVFSSSYQEGRPETWYKAELKEIDVPPTVEIIEIAGQSYSVLKYDAMVIDEEKEVVIWTALLRLSEEESIGVQNLFRDAFRAGNPLVQVRRIGVDADPIERKIYQPWWSRHTDEQGVYYKQLIRFRQPDLPPDFFPSRLHFASAAQQEALTEMVVELAARFEALVDELTYGKKLTEAQRSMLLGENWEQFHDVTRLGLLTWRTYRLSDAEEAL